jgi:hypothetical protein
MTGDDVIKGRDIGDEREIRERRRRRRRVRFSGNDEGMEIPVVIQRTTRVRRFQRLFKEQRV